jgi:hypothetical protein
LGFRRLEYKKPNNLDGVPFNNIKKWIKEIYDRGGISTISWHMDNPLTLKTLGTPHLNLLNLFSRMDQNTNFINLG